ncbi:hypothetical protein NXH64_14825 [Butyrivibrio fibrisolvens]|uniref:hypothetical protein n=1 Tax=Pseudobutyrivibrio ruminis TaxID=46206 RepID=UPI00047F6F75|nr:hypothetical protein [Pseudobutyrivibrio ruminis]MDC7280773.1 hypothetical protein [Butyrivibrio fibrisolvens]
MKKKHVFRFIFIFTIALMWGFAPVPKPFNYRMEHEADFYPVKEDYGVRPGKYTVTVIEEGKFADYEIYSSYVGGLNNIVDCHYINSDREIVIAEGQYIKLINCTARLVKE